MLNQIRKYRGKALLAGLFWVALGAHGANTDIANIPMAVQNNVSPNFMFMIDSSGSMTNIVPEAPYSATATYLTAAQCSGRQPAPSYATADLASAAVSTSSTPSYFDLLVTRILEGAQANGNATEKLYLYDLKIEPCIDCRACKKGKFQCPIKDDMQKVYPKLEKADVIVFGTPMYWYGPTATMKLIVDRLRPYISSKKLRGKGGVLVIPSEEGASKCTGMVDMFRCSFRYLGMNFAGKVLAQAYEKAEVEKHPQVLLSAFELGKELK